MLTPHVGMSKARFQIVGVRGPGLTGSVTDLFRGTAKLSSSLKDFVLTRSGHHDGQTKASMSVIEMLSQSRSSSGQVAQWVSASLNLSDYEVDHLAWLQNELFRRCEMKTSRAASCHSLISSYNSRYIM